MQKYIKKMRNPNFFAKIDYLRELFDDWIEELEAVAFWI